jgi:phosphinothricin acetyltransferase
MAPRSSIEPLIRPARPEDAAALAGIYAPEVLHGTATFETEPPPPEEMADRLARVQARGWPWLVADHEGVLLGYAYATQFRERAAYAIACENSIYVAASARGLGVGRMLMAALITTARNTGFETMVAVIGDIQGNAASLALHAGLGFQETGRLIGVARKFGQTLDIAFLQRAL